MRTLEHCERTILVVDDEAAGRDLMTSLLASQGYHVKTACDGMGALALIEAGGIDLVLLDLMMSKLDGVEVCTHIRKSGHSPHLPVIFTTSLHDRASRIRAKEAGADEFLVKPIDALELLLGVERLLRLRAQSELLVAERDRLLKELSRLRASLHANGKPAPEGALATLSTEELLCEHRHLLSEAMRVEARAHAREPGHEARAHAREPGHEARTREPNGDDCASDCELRAHLEELLRVSEEIERRIGTAPAPFPFAETRSTV